MTEETRTLPVTTPTEGSDGMAVEELLAKAEDAPMVFPSDSETDVQRETDDQPGMKATRVSGAGYKYIWDTRTFERFAVLYYMFGQKLKEKRQDRSLRFTSEKPAGTPVKGTFKCVLHSDAPLREHYDAIGLRTCRKANLMNRYQVQQHLRKKHPQEFATIEDEKAEMRQQEILDAQKAQTEALLALAGRTVENAPDAAPEPAGETLYQCPKCEISPFTSEAGMKRHRTIKH